MPVRNDKNYQRASGLNVNAETVNKTSASIIKRTFKSPEEVTGCLVRAHLKTGKKADAP